MMVNKQCAFYVIFLCSAFFLLIQMFIFGSMKDWEILRKVKDTHKIKLLQQNGKVWAAIKEFLEACKSVKLKMILVDTEILQHLVQRVQKFSDKGNVAYDGHGKCHYFCSKNVVTFAVYGSNFQGGNIWEELSKILGRRGFKSQLFKETDERDLTLESISTIKKLPSHAVLRKKVSMIHIVVLHERRGQYWSATCSSMKTRKFGRHLLQVKKSPFCINQNLVQKFATTKITMDKMELTVPLYLRSFLNKMKHSRFIPCDLNKARQFFSKYGLDDSAEAGIFKLHARNVLSDVRNVLDKLKVPFWLSSGTCLGWFRQCDFIPHSKDVDIGIFIKDYNPRISEGLQKAGLMPKHIFGKIEDSYELSFRTPSNDIKLDIFFFYENSNHMWNGGTQAKTGKKFKYRFPKFRICWTDFADLLVRVPCNTLAYVQANYGHEWNTRIKDWDWKSSPSNVEENGQWSREELSQVVQVFD